mgnify:CR=1 FL=1
MTTPAQKGGWSDEPTGRDGFGRQVRPVDPVAGSVRTSFSHAEGLRFCPLSESSRSRSSSRTISPSCTSTELVGELVGSWSESKTPSTVIGSRGGAVAVRKRRRAPTGGAIPAEAGACPRPDRRLAAAVIHRITANESAVAVAVAGAGRYRTLHLWAAMVRTPANHRLSVCTPIEGCAA